MRQLRFLPVAPKRVQRGGACGSVAVRVMVPVWIQTVGTLSQLFLSVPVYPHKFVLMTPQVFKPSFVSPVNAMPQLLCQFVVSSHNDQLIAIFRILPCLMPPATKIKSCGSRVAKHLPCFSHA